ncbi:MULTISPECIES: GNAT family N-acetyltransferase [Rhodomicrobium]|uniref:GNAT family N-acetyltransferase n=1 Tax=Rhodomicrobium TaxID=1068 RepID=UPI001482A04D|nr:MULTISPECIES: GNAT family N-acetyltransferase [Rhodomicrobium]
MQPAAAESLGGDLAAMVPWARLGTSRDQLTGFLSASDDNKRSFSIIADGGLAGVIVVRFPWLSGPYLNLLAVLDGQRSKGVGRAALGWFEAEARAAGARNAFLCVSAFNAPAIAFYRRNGYSQATVLEDLIKDGEDEFLMRKRLR